MIVVTGVHRSGTSFFSHALAELGVDFGDTASHLDADRWNQGGYFESRDVVDLNCEILTGLRFTGSALARSLGRLRYAMMPSLRVVRRRARRLSQRLTETGAAYRSRGVKDPRFCLTLREWSERAAVEAVVFCVRSPDAVAASLRRRQRIPLEYGLRFWAYHVEAFLDATEGATVPIVYVDFDAIRGGDCIEHLRRLARAAGVVRTDDELMDLRSRVFSQSHVHHGGGGASRHPRAGPAWMRLCERMNVDA